LNNRKEADMEYLHIYEIVGQTRLGVIFYPKELRHTKAEIIKKTRSIITYRIGNEAVGTIHRKRLDRVSREGTKVVLTTPDNELAIQLFTNYINDLIQEREESIKIYRQALKIVKAFKD
jgi:hypothetical protein